MELQTNQQVCLLKYQKVVEPNGQVITFLANGCVFTIEGDQNIVEFDGLWIGNSSSRPVSSVDGQWIAF